MKQTCTMDRQGSTRFVASGTAAGAEEGYGSTRAFLDGRRGSHLEWDFRNSIFGGNHPASSAELVKTDLSETWFASMHQCMGSRQVTSHLCSMSPCARPMPRWATMLSGCPSNTANAWWPWHDKGTLLCDDSRVCAHTRFHFASVAVGIIEIFKSQKISKDVDGVRSSELLIFQCGYCLVTRLLLTCSCFPCTCRRCPASSLHYM